MYISVLFALEAQLIQLEELYKFSHRWCFINGDRHGSVYKIYLELSYGDSLCETMVV